MTQRLGQTSTELYHRVTPRWYGYGATHKSARGRVTDKMASKFQTRIWLDAAVLSFVAVAEAMVPRLTL